MKTSIISLITAALLIHLMVSCEPDPCENVQCNNGATCEDGVCSCLQGYEGSDCSTESRSKFVAIYSVVDTDCTGVGAVLTIEPDTLSVSKVIISFPNGVSGGWVFSANVSGNTLTIPLQTPSSVGSGNFSDWTVSGSATLNGSYLFLQRHCTGPAGSPPCESCIYNCVKM